LIEFFDRAGQAAAFCQDGQSICLWDGTPVGYLVNDAVYAFSGRLVGWSQNGWICDEDGKPILFEFDAVGGPEKPKRQTKTAAGLGLPLPIKVTPDPRSPRPTMSHVWSDRRFADLV